MKANIGHLPTKFGYKQMQGWKVIQVFVSVTDGRRTDGRTQFGSLVSPPPRWARQKSEDSTSCNDVTHPYHTHTSTPLHIHTRTQTHRHAHTLKHTPVMHTHTHTHTHTQSHHTYTNKNSEDSTSRHDVTYTATPCWGNEMRMR